MSADLPQNHERAALIVDLPINGNYRSGQEPHAFMAGEIIPRFA